MIFAAVSVPGCPGNEKSTVSRSLTVLVTDMPARVTSSQPSMTSLRCRNTHSPNPRTLGG